MAKYHLFDVIGVELEYMIVTRDTLRVAPICDELIKSVNGDYTSDVENGEVAWSNELVAHVVELKTNGPATSLSGLDVLFHNNVLDINRRLADLNAELLPCASHPTMNPLTETVIWPHEYNAVYSLYNSIFDCRGHGWSNVQSTHINLPFANDDEFARLHAAIRVILPLIPALSASSPILDGKYTGFADSRLEHYRHNQQKIPSIAGKVIPEAVFSEAEYHAKIFDVIKKDIAPYDKENVLDFHFLNSRGAIARFDRGAIEIRIVDIQECPKADLAIVELIVAVVKRLTLASEEQQTLMRSWHENDLAAIFLQVIRSAENTVIDNERFLRLFGILDTGVTVGQIWKILASREELTYSEIISYIVENGSLSSRITRAIGPECSHHKIQEVYQKLALCLSENKLF